MRTVVKLTFDGCRQRLAGGKDWPAARNGGPPQGAGLGHGSSGVTLGEEVGENISAKAAANTKIGS